MNYALKSRFISVWFIIANSLPKAILYHSPIYSQSCMLSSKVLAEMSGSARIFLWWQKKGLSSRSLMWTLIVNTKHYCPELTRVKAGMNCSSHEVSLRALFGCLNNFIQMFSPVLTIWLQLFEGRRGGGWEKFKRDWFNDSGQLGKNQQYLIDVPIRHQSYFSYH